MNPVEVLTKLLHDDLYLQWKKNHSQVFLTHFFCSIDTAFLPLGGWEIGFFDPEKSKITVFALLDNQAFEIKPADDVFSKDPGSIEALQQEKVKISFEQAVESCKNNLQQYFGQEQRGNGFAILQTYQHQTVWNFTFITKTLRFINLKIEAETGQLQSHETINLVQK